jgi:hypothetical protein
MFSFIHAGGPSINVSLQRTRSIVFTMILTISEDIRSISCSQVDECTQLRDLVASLTLENKQQRHQIESLQKHVQNLERQLQSTAHKSKSGRNLARFESEGLVQTPFPRHSIDAPTRILAKEGVPDLAAHRIQSDGILPTPPVDEEEEEDFRQQLRPLRRIGIHPASNLLGTQPGPAAVGPSRQQQSLKRILKPRLLPRELELDQN